MKRIHRYRILPGLFAALLCGAVAAWGLPPGQVFGDVPQIDPTTGQPEPEYAATLTLFQLGISVGCDTTPDFCPAQSLVRSDMAAFIVRAWSARVFNDPEAFKTLAPPNETCTNGTSVYFSDVSCGAAQFPYIQKLYELGITSGTVGPTIGQNGNVTAQGQFAPASTLINVQIAIFLARARNSADYGCYAAYYTVPKPFTPSTNPSCTPNGFPSVSEAPYFTDVCSPTPSFPTCPPNSDPTYFTYVQRLGDLGVFQSPSTIVGYSGCTSTSCQFYEDNTILRSQMAIWTVTAMGLVPRSLLSIAGGSNVYPSALPTITVPFTFTLYNQTAASIEYGQFLLQSSSAGDAIQSPEYCYGAWSGSPTALNLYDPPTVQQVTGYGNPLADSFCTVSLVSVTNQTASNGVQTMQGIVNFTFTPAAQGATYNVFHEVYYNVGADPWENVGTLTVGVPTSTVVLTDLTTPTAPPYYAGDNFQVTITGPAGQVVTASSNGGYPGNVGTIPGTSGTGVLTITGHWQNTDIGPYTQVWYVGGMPAAGLSFQVAATPALVVTDVSPDSAFIGSNNILITITGAGFQSSPVVNLPPGFTSTGQASTSTSIVVTASIGTGAVAGPNNISVTVAGVTSNSTIFTVNAPTITSVSPNIQMIGSNNIVITIGGAGFLSPTVNLPTGFTTTAQANVSSQSVEVKVNIGFTAVIGSNNGNNNITVTVDGVTSNAVPFTVNGPAQMVVLGDFTGPDPYYGGYSRFTTYQVQNADGTAAANIPIAEAVTESNYTCTYPATFQGSITQACVQPGTNGTPATTDANGEFTDDWGFLISNAPAGCGIDTVDHWQWCGPRPPAPYPGITFATLVGTQSTSSVTLKAISPTTGSTTAYTNPPTSMPANAVIKP